MAVKIGINGFGRIGRMVFRAVIKPATTTRTATTTLTDDPHLTFPVVANAKYRFWFSVFFDTTAAGDFKIALNGPASPTAVRFFRYAVAPGGTSLTAIGVSTALGGAGLGGGGTAGQRHPRIARRAGALRQGA